MAEKRGLKDGLGELLDALDTLSVPRAGKPKPKKEKGMQVRGTTVKGVRYVRLEDVCELLEANDVLPKIVARWREQM